MTKKPKQESQEDQSARFEKAVQDMIKDGELNPTEADEEMDKFVLNIEPKAQGNKGS